MFEYINLGTAPVTGRLKGEATAQDREIYVNKLIEYSNLRAGLQKLADENVFVSMSKLACFHHSSRALGDLKAPSSGRPVPDFKCNSRPTET